MNQLVPNREIVTKTLRSSKELDDRINELAAKTGASYNSTVCLLIQMGLKAFSS
ncbi:hypothetical protein ABNF65_11525 [Paenibacillus larvae]